MGATVSDFTSMADLIEGVNEGDWPKTSVPMEQAAELIGGSNSRGCQSTSEQSFQVTARPQDRGLEMSTNGFNPPMKLCTKTRPGSVEQRLSESSSAKEPFAEKRMMSVLFSPESQY